MTEAALHHSPPIDPTEKKYYFDQFTCGVCSGERESKRRERLVSATYRFEDCQNNNIVTSRREHEIQEYIRECEKLETANDEARKAVRSVRITPSAGFGRP